MAELLDKQRFLPNGVTHHEIFLGVSFADAQPFIVRLVQGVAEVIEITLMSFIAHPRFSLPYSPFSNSRHLAHLMEQHGISQYQLDKEGVYSQQNSSRILKGERGTSLKLAKKLAERFGVGTELFI